MKQLILFAAFIIAAMAAKTQDKFYTKTGKINFDATSTSSPENIDGVNKSVVCVADIKTGNIQFSVLMKGFEFARALMQEHFNENYAESDKFPKAEFKGVIVNNSSVNYAKDGTYAVKVKGKLTMHGETKDVETDGKIIVSGGKLSAAATFSVLLADYKISIPAVVADKVSKSAKIIVNCSLDPLKS